MERIALIAAAGLCIAALVVARRGVRLISQSHRRPRASFDAAAEPGHPTELGMPYEEVALRASDDVTLRGWYVPAPGDGPAGAVIGMHGGGDTRQYYLPLAPALHAAGHAVLLVDGRCHGQSDVTRQGCTLGGRERLDVRAAAAWLAARGHARIAAIGASQGGAAVVVAAAADPRIDAVVVESSSHDLAGPYRWVFRSRPGAAALSRFLAIAAALAFWGPRPASWRGFGQQYRAIARLSPRPVLMIHGARDPLIPLEIFEKYWSRARDPRERWVLPEGRHCVLRHDPGAFARRVVAFLEGPLRAEGASPLTKEPLVSSPPDEETPACPSPDASSPPTPTA